MKRTIVACLTLLACLGTGVVQAQDWPQRPVTLILPVPAGNVNDLAARIVAQELTEIYGQQFLVENYSGAGGVPGMNKFLSSAADGYTFGFLPGSVVTITPLLNGDVDYAVFEDFVPVAPVGDVPYIVAVSAASDISSMATLIERAKSEPGALRFASQFIGSGAHLIAERFSAALGIKFTMIPYPGVTEAVTSVVNGESQVTMQAVSTMKGFIESGQLRPFAVTSAERLRGWPDLPTTSELQPNTEATAWFGIFALPDTPAEIIDDLGVKVEQVVNMPEVIERFENGGIYPIHGRATELAAKIRAEAPMWEGIVRDAGLLNE